MLAIAVLALGCSVLYQRGDLLSASGRGSAIGQVGYEGAGHEYPIVVQPGAALDLGQVRFITTRVQES